MLVVRVHGIQAAVFVQGFAHMYHVLCMLTIPRRTLVPELLAFCNVDVVRSRVKGSY